MKRSTFSFTVLFSSVLSLVFVFWSTQVGAQTQVIPPPTTTSISISNLSKTGFDVNWRAPDTGGVTITGYDVQYKNISTTGNSFVDAGHTGTTTSVTISGLTKYTKYEIQIRTLTANGNSAWSTSVSTRTLGDIPAPSSLTASDRTTTGFKVSWTAPTTTETITSYDVRYRTVGILGSFVSANTTDTKMTLSGLTPNTSYEVQVRAKSANQSSPWTVSPNSLSVSTLAETVLTELGTPSDVTTSNRTTTGFDVSWTAPTTTLTITGYDVQYRVTTVAAFTDAGHTGTDTSISLTGLTSNTAYAVQVRAKSANGNGAWSSLVYVATVASAADTLPSLSGEEQLLLGRLLTYDTLIFNELHNNSDDANDWLELRNISNVDISIENWKLTIQTGSDTAIIPFPAGTAIPAGEVLLITNTEMAPAAVVLESFVLPQTEFALILRSPTAFGDLAGNYFQSETERPETAPELTVDTVWERVEATTSGYRAEAWAESTHRNGLGSPGYHPSTVTGDLNRDGVLNILDLVLVASQFGTTGPSAADLNGDNTVNIQDLVLVANALGNVGAAPSAKQPTAAMINTWLQLAQQNAADTIPTSLPDGFSYTRGIQMLQQLVEALTPDTTALLANYPNPFNPETWIPYQLAKAADVTVTIYASEGGVVRTLALGHQEAGMYKNRSQAAYWDGKNELGEAVASGLYFYTLTAGDFTATRRMLILK